MFKRANTIGKTSAGLLIASILGAARSATSAVPAAHKNLGRSVRGGFIGTKGKIVIAAKSRRSGGTVAQAKRNAVKARNRARNKAAHRG